MPYGTFSQPDTVRVVYSDNNQDAAPAVLVNTGTQISRTEVRTGSKKQPGPNNTSFFRKYSFSKDGKTVRVYLGSQSVPVRRYRWAGSRKNRYKQYYIAYVEKHIYQDIPKPQYSYRNMSLNKSNLVTLLQPNSLEYEIDQRTYPLPRYVYTPVEPGNKTFTLDLYQGLRGRMDPAVASSNMNSMLPFTIWTWSGSSAESTRLKNEALRTLYERVSSRFPDVGTMIGESKESVNMLRLLASEGCDLVADLLLKDKKRLAGRLKAPADFASKAWLTYFYGIKPLISDVASLQDLPNQYGIRTYKATKRFYSPMQQRVSGLSGLAKIRSDSSYSIDVTYGVIMSADLRGGQRFGAMNLLNPIGVGYNLIPFSFMVDWFYDLGSFLNNQSALQYGFLYGWETVVSKSTTLEFVGAGNPVSGWSLPVGMVLPFRREWCRVDRKVFSKTQFPALPTPKADLLQDSSIRGLNALAIAVQRSKL